MNDTKVVEFVNIHDHASSPGGSKYPESVTVSVNGSGSVDAVSTSDNDKLSSSFAPANYDGDTNLMIQSIKRRFLSREEKTHTKDLVFGRCSCSCCC